MIDRKKIIEIATKEIGYREGQNNDNKYGRWFGFNNAAWCSMFVCWVYKEAGYPIKGDWPNGYASVPNFYRWAKENGCLTTEPKPGDSVIFDWNKDGNPDHIGLYKNGDELFCNTIEGNTGDSNWSNGDGVYARVRKTSLILGYIDIEKVIAAKGTDKRDHTPEQKVYKLGDKGEMV